MSDRIDILNDCAGFCTEIGRHILGHERAFPFNYMAYYFLTEEQFKKIKKMQEKFKQLGEETDEKEEENEKGKAVFYCKSQILECKESTDTRHSLYTYWESYLHSEFSIGCEAGAEYIRDYICSKKFRALESPLPSKCGPFLYEDGIIYFHFYIDGKHYAVPPHDYTKMRHNFTGDVHTFNDIQERTNGPYKMFFYNGDQDYFFVGKEVTEFEGYDEWKKWAEDH